MIDLLEQLTARAQGLVLIARKRRWDMRASREVLREASSELRWIDDTALEPVRATIKSLAIAFCEAGKWDDAHNAIRETGPFNVEGSFREVFAWLQARGAAPRNLARAFQPLRDLESCPVSKGRIIHAHDLFALELAPLLNEVADAQELIRTNVSAALERLVRARGALESVRIRTTGPVARAWTRVADVQLDLWEFDDAIDAALQAEALCPSKAYKARTETVFNVVTFGVEDDFMGELADVGPGDDELRAGT